MAMSLFEFRLDAGQSLVSYRMSVMFWIKYLELEHNER
jgi:uncharacterized protein involved in type VI secretion and phage assembly